MRTTQKIQNGLEIRFWEMAIPLMSSKSPMVNKLVKVGYQIYNQYQPRNLLFKMLFWSSMGLSFGLAIGLLIP